jgi:hypothetical protein
MSVPKCYVRKLLVYGIPTWLNAPKAQADYTFTSRRTSKTSTSPSLSILLLIKVSEMICLFDALDRLAAKHDATPVPYLVQCVQGVNALVTQHSM